MISTLKMWSYPAAYLNKLEVQANLHAAINFHPEVSAIPFRKIFHFGNSQRALPSLLPQTQNEWLSIS